jgi:predicted nucleic acid-binding protein
MICNVTEGLDFFNDVLPFTKNGILIDTSVMKIFIDGFISTRFSNKPVHEYETLLKFFDLIKVRNEWNKFIITPHILTEICGHLNKDCRKKYKHIYGAIVKEILPFLEEMDEQRIEKNRILNSIEFKNPIIEVGDLSIFLVTDDFIKEHRKVSILVKDDGFNERFKNNPNVQIFDYNNIIWNLS